MGWPILLSAFAAGLVGAETLPPGTEPERLCFEPVAWAWATLEEVSESSSAESSDEALALHGAFDGAADPAAVGAVLGASSRGRRAEPPLICLAGAQNDPRCAVHDGDAGESPWGRGAGGTSSQPALSAATLRFEDGARISPTPRAVGRSLPEWRRRLDRPPRA